MRTINGIIRELEDLKKKAGRDRLNNEDKRYILQKKKSELKLKADQIREEMQREVDDLFTYLNLKQASLETLSAMSVYIEEETRKVDEQMTGITRPAREAKGA